MPLREVTRREKKRWKKRRGRCNTRAGVQGKRIIAEEIAAGIADGETELQVIDRLIANLKGKQEEYVLIQCFRS